MLNSFEKKRNLNVIETVRQAIRDDKARREKFNIDKQYSFIPEKLQNILKRLEDNLDYSEEELISLPPWHRDIAENERVIFIYLYNAKGKHQQVWEQLLSNKSLREYSFNRPIYQKRSDVERVLNHREDSPNHAFISVVVKKNHIIESTGAVDSLGGQRIRLVEGSLDADNILEFVHNNKEYYRDNRCRLLLKEDV